MHAATVAQLVTADEFADMPDPPDGSRLELVRGAIVTMSRPQSLHGFVCVKVGRIVGNYVDDNGLGWVLSESGVITERKPDTVRGPDVAFWSFDRMPTLPKKYADIAPDLAVEILSPSNTRKEIRAKIREYFFNGSKLVWVVDPEAETLSVYREPDASTTLEGEREVACDDVLPGFRCRVSDLFRLPQPKPQAPAA